MSIRVPKILIPKNKKSLPYWATIACDQFTSEQEYWDELKELVGRRRSTLKITFPEIYLKKSNKTRVKSINTRMQSYLRQDMFKEYDTIIFVVRTLSNGKKRLGIMVELNLDDYDYKDNNTAKVRATEKTVMERLPVRMEVRENALLETPHIMLLMDDREERYLEYLYSNIDQMQKIYDFDLNMNGGHIEGYRVEKSQKLVRDILGQERDGILFLVGDGNHSLATAKACYEKEKLNKKDNELAKYALCEVVSLYDSSLEFEPIHRVLFNADENCINSLRDNLSGDRKITLYFKGQTYEINAPAPAEAIAKIQEYIDQYLLENPKIKIDYIHGDDNLKKIADRENAVGIFMPTIEKHELFDYVRHFGTLPRKAFSMGQPEDKRYYLETRKIK